MSNEDFLSENAVILIWLDVGSDVTPKFDCVIFMFLLFVVKTDLELICSFLSIKEDLGL